MTEPRTEARFYTPTGPHQKTRCILCPHRCLIEPDGVGFCEVRKNIDGILYSLNYGVVSSQSIEPIEHTLFNFYPGSLALAVGSLGCNFECKGCQSWQASQSPKISLRTPVIQCTPQQIVASAKKFDCQSIVFGSNDPVVWYEFLLDTQQICRQNNVKVVLWTNGFITSEALATLAPHLDAVNLDFKFFSDRGYRDNCGVTPLQTIKETAEYLHNQHVHLEITNLLIPGKNTALSDIRLLCEWIRDNLGTHTPLHFAAFMPDYQQNSIPPTPISILIAARNLALEIGLKYVYTRNIGGLDGENTFCPICHQKIIRRVGGELLDLNITVDRKCGFCGEPLAITGQVKRSNLNWRSIPER